MIVVSALPGVSSSALKMRPMAGLTRRRLNVPSVTLMAETLSGSATPVIVTWLLAHMPMSSNARFSSR